MKTTVTLLTLSLMIACIKKHDFIPSQPPRLQYQPDTTYSNYFSIEPHFDTYDTIPGNFIALFTFGTASNTSYFPKISAMYGTASWSDYRVRYLLASEDLQVGGIKVNAPHRVELEIVNTYNRAIFQAYREKTLENTVYMPPSFTLAFSRADSDTSIPDLMKKINTLLRRNIDTVRFTRGF
jgi:hypothetical protein